MAMNRRLILLAAVTAALQGCSPAEPPVPEGDPPPVLERVVEGSWRPELDRARDEWRHPAETLTFFGLAPGMTVVEIWPGAGWYSDILAPFLDQTGGTFYAATQPGDDPAEPNAAQLVDAYVRKLESAPRIYGEVNFTQFGPGSGPMAPDGTADMVLTFRNVHDWIARGIAEKAFADAYAALKPGGILGVVEHRAESGGLQDLLASTGYVQENYVRQLAAEAGFAFVESSEINANPDDTHDHPFGVWTLPPTRLTAPRGQPADPTFDRTDYDAIGESDRMTLKFQKPL
jgi:predicted methyltransferase